MQTLGFPVPLFIGGILGGLFGLSATIIFHFSIMPAVNRSVPDEQRIPIYETDLNLFEVLRRHKALFPYHKLRSLMFALAGLAVFSVFGGFFVLCAEIAFANLVMRR